MKYVHLHYMAEQTDGNSALTSAHIIRSIDELKFSDIQSKPSFEEFYHILLETSSSLSRNKSTLTLCTH